MQVSTANQKRHCNQEKRGYDNAGFPYCPAGGPQG
jgi:hypothetical protein